MRLPDRFSSDYISGVNAFIDFAFGHRDDLMLTQDQYDSLSWYVLNNCEELQEYL